MTEPSDESSGAPRKSADSPHVGPRFGALRGRIRYDDADFDGPDQEILRMFYGDDDSEETVTKP